MAIQYTPAPQTMPIAGELGSPGQFTALEQLGALSSGEVDRYAFSLRNSEVASTAGGAVLIGFELFAAVDSDVEPSVPTIPGLTPLAIRQSAGAAYALFTVDAEGLHLVEVASGDTSGDYTLRLSIAGDVAGMVNDVVEVGADGKVDGGRRAGGDGRTGTTPADAGYFTAADADRDGGH